MSHTTTRIGAVELRTPAALAALAKRFDPVVVQPDDTPVPSAKDDYFARMAITRNVEHDSGSSATYDVQSDNRFLANYIQYNIAAQYPEMNVKGHPMVSPLSLAGYCMIIFNAHLLGCDAHFRPQKSCYARFFMADQGKKDYFDVLLNCHVPTFLADILTELAPVYDARRTNHIFVPSLAGYSHAHDFGRTLPPHIWLIAHHLLATTQTRMDPSDYQALVYEQLVTTYSNQAFRIGNYLGTHYGSEHPNWVNNDFESFFNPLVGRSLTQKPTFGKLNLIPQEAASFAEFDIYEHFLIADDDNIDVMSNFVGSISAFVASHDPKSPKLGNILASLSGALIFSHSIEPVTLPTWTGHKLSDSKKLGKQVSDKKFAEEHKFLAKPKTYTGSIKFPGADALNEIFTGLYRLVNSTYDPTATHTPHTLFDPRTHVSPYVLYFQPYDVNSSSIALTIIAGIKIELAEIDGFTVPTEHPESSLDDNNSQYQQAAVRLSNIDTILDSDTYTTSAVRILDRRHVDRDNQATGFAIRDMSRNVLPFFANGNVNNTSIQANYSAGFETEQNHNNASTAFTYTAGANGTLSVPAKFKIYGWSSYRIVHKLRAELTDVSMVLSFRPVYGTNVTLSRSKNPSLVIPH
jgi:hypothetical protein